MKRGQVTIFIGLGIVIVAALVLAITFRGDIAKIVTEGAAEEQAGFSSQVDSVKKHVDGCLSNALTESVFALASKKLDDYDEALAGEVKLRASMCLQLDSFTDITARKLGEPEVEIKRNPDNTLITATMTLPINVEQDGNEEQLKEFIAQETLKKKMCALKEMLDDDCRAKEDMVVGIFVFKQGEEAKIGGECLAC